MAGRVKARTSHRIVTRPDAPDWEKPGLPAVDVDWAEVEAIRATGRHRGQLPVTGHCHDCGRPVSGERRYCGPCLARH